MKPRVRVANPGDGGLWWRLPVLALLWSLIVIPVGVAYEVVSTARRWAKDLPAVPDLASWKIHAPQSSTIVAADGSLLAEVPFRDGKVFGHRTLVSLERAPHVLVEAVLAAEDVRFYRHKGADYTAIARAAYLNYQAGRVVEGASTITQQVARNLLPDSIGTSRNARRKFREILLAREIERHWSKREILEVYLSFVFLGEGAYGMEAAAQIYFDKDIADLDVAQSAMLAGLIQAPGRLDPYRHPERAKARRDEILARMARAELITEAERAAAVASPVALTRPAPTYGARVPWYTEKARSLVAEALPDDLARGGLTVETAALPALGTDLQARAADQADRWKQAGENGLVPQIASIVWDHETGYVEAIVGGRKWGSVGTSGDQFDRFLMSCRQPGSAWKAMVYGAALESGVITPGTALRDAPIVEYDEVTNVHYRPKSGNKFRGLVLAEDAFASSLNAPAIDVFDHVGAPRIVDFARRLGISTKISQLRPMALGASCVKPIELARAYAVIARRGWSLAPRFVVRVRRGDESLFDAAVPEDPWLDSARRIDRMAATAGSDPDVRVSAKGGRVVDEETAFQLQHMMAAVVSRGTASVGGPVGRPAAGKTGTTNDNTDAWFVGYTGRVLAATWIGFDSPVTKLGHEGDGAHAALPLWLEAVKLAEGDRDKVAVPGKPPPGLELHTIDRETGFLAAPHAGGLDVWFKKGTQPTAVAGAPGTSPGDFAATAREF